MSNYIPIINPFNGQLQLALDATLLKIKGSVATTANLPLTGNLENDCYIVKNVDRLYTWNSTESSGTVDKWVDVGSFSSIDWSAIANKPSSAVEDIDNAVTQKHSQGTDQGLDIGGVNEVSVADIKQTVDDFDSHKDAQNVHVISGDVVSTDDGQVLTNKMIIGADNIRGQYRDVSIFTYPFTSVCYFDGVDYLDLTDESKTIAGTPFNLLADTDDRFYVGIDNLNYWYGEIYFALDVVGVGINLVVEYFNELDQWVDIGLIEDYTVNLTQSGKLFYNNPSDWKMTEVNGYLGYFVRIRTTTVPSQIPTSFVVSPFETVLGVQPQEGNGLVYPLEVKADGKVRIRTSLSDDANEVTIAELKDTVDKSHDAHSDDQDLSGKEDVANKSTDANLGTSDTLYPSQKAVKDYVDANAGGSVTEAQFLNNLYNMVVLGFYRAIDGTKAIYNLVNGFIDKYIDETGIDTVNSSGEDYNSGGHYYSVEIPTDEFFNLNETTGFFAGGTPSASGAIGGYEAAKVFDGSAVTSWQVDSALPVWIKYDLGEGNEKLLRNYTITPAHMAPLGPISPTSWQFQGSNNDSDWTTLNTQTSYTWVNDTKIRFLFANDTAYRYYRLYITASELANYCGLREITGGTIPYNPPFTASRFWANLSISGDGKYILAGSFISMTGDKLYLSSDFGVTFNEIQPGGITSAKWMSSAINSDGSVMIVCPEIPGVYDCYISTNYGVTWSPVNPSGITEHGGGCNYYYTASMSNDGSIIIVGEDTEGSYCGRLYLSTNTGANWTEVRPKGDVMTNWDGSAMSSDGDVILVGECFYGSYPAASNTGRLFLSTNTGANWTEVRPKGDVATLWGMKYAMSSDGDVILVGEDSGRLYLSTDTGANWTEVRPKGDADGYWRQVAMTKSGSMLFACDNVDGRVWMSADLGDSWTDLMPNGDIDGDWGTIACSYTGAALVTATSKLFDDPSVGDIFIKTSTLTDLILISEKQDLSEQPNLLRVVLLLEIIGETTLNTDIKFWISLDDGETYSQVTLQEEATFSGNIKILTGSIDTSEIVGTELVYKIATYNNINTKIHGCAILEE